MSNDELIREVRDAIGTASKDDEPLDPKGHKELLEATAPSIARILDDSTVTATAEQQRVAAAPAREAQRTFKRQSSLAAWLIVLAATASAAIMVTGSTFPDTDPLSVYQKVSSIIFAIIGLAAATGAATLLRIIQGNKLLEKWMESRASAETKRLEYFARVTNAPPNEGDDPIRTRLEQLEYFRRYQLDGQFYYYSSACERHDRAATRAVTNSAITIGVAGFVNAAAGMLGAWHPELAAIAALGVVAQSIGSKLANDEAISQDGRNAERYRRTRDSLLGLQGRLDEVRKSIASGNEQTLPAFVEAVHEQLSLEHRQWIESRDELDAAMARLKEQIDAAKKKLAGDGVDGVPAPAG